jgi:NADH dehydrogenase FAD-containing subunit
MVQDKKITVVHGRSKLLNPAYPNRARDAVARKLRKHDIGVILNERVVSTAIEEGGVVRTASGKTIPTDLLVRASSRVHPQVANAQLQIRATGAIPSTNFLKSLGADVLTPCGSVPVLPTLQLPGHPTIFALGDIIRSPGTEQKNMSKTFAQSTVIAHNILTLAASKPAEVTIKEYCHSTFARVTRVPPPKLMHYRGTKEVLIVTMGPEMGVGYLGFLWGFVVGDWVASVVGGRTMWANQARKLLGY